jgi:tetratricopeptide (TPR) repeat protein
LFDEALAGLEREKRDRKNDPLLIYSTGMIYAAQGKRADALAIITQLEAMSGSHTDQALWIAMIYAALKDREHAFEWLERGLAARSLGRLLTDVPVWDVLRSDRRFDDLFRQMGGTP